MVLLSAAGLALAVSLLAPFGIKPLLRRLNVVDIPTVRSSHSGPAIRGAGLATLAGFVAGCVVLLVWGKTADLGLITIILCSSIAAAGVGWVEDCKGISIKLRIVWQIVIGMTATGLIAALSGSQLWLIGIGGILVAGFINVANFMDGIDGISAFHGAIFGAMYAVAGLLTAEWWLVATGLILSAVYLAFIPWNLGKESIFLGDSGSYLLGGAVSVMAIAAVCSGISPLMMVGPLAIYLADSSFTLLSRISRGERWYESHRAHIYHQLEDLGMRHVSVAGIVAGASCLTGVLGFLAARTTPWGALLYIAFAVAVIAAYLASPQIIRQRDSRRNEGGITSENVEHG